MRTFVKADCEGRGFFIKENGGLVLRRDIDVRVSAAHYDSARKDFPPEACVDNSPTSNSLQGPRRLASASRDANGAYYGTGLTVGVAWAAFWRSRATFAVACCSRSASFCRFWFGVGVGFTLAASSEREQAPKTSAQRSEIAVSNVFMMEELAK